MGHFLQLHIKISSSPKRKEKKRKGFDKINVEKHPYKCFFILVLKNIVSVQYLDTCEICKLFYIYTYDPSKYHLDIGLLAKEKDAV